jgi:hypothetical protein
VPGEEVTAGIHLKIFLVSIIEALALDFSAHSTYFTPAQSPNGDTVMRINGRESPTVDFGDGTIQVKTYKAF